MEYVPGVRCANKGKKFSIIWLFATVRPGFRQAFCCFDAESVRLSVDIGVGAHLRQATGCFSAQDEKLSRSPKFLCRSGAVAVAMDGGSGGACGQGAVCDR